MNLIIKKFFELKFEQLLTKVIAAQHFRIGYTNQNINELFVFLKYKQIAENKEEELIIFCMENLELLKENDLQELSELDIYKITEEVQKELSKAIYGKEYTIDDLVKIAEEACENHKNI